MTRQSLFSDLWDEENQEAGTRRACFGSPTTPGWGNVVRTRLRNAGEPHPYALPSGRDVLRPPRQWFRNQHGEEALGPADFVFSPEGQVALHPFSTPTDEPAKILAISAGSFPEVVAYPEHGCAWVTTRDPDPELLAKGGDPGLIAPFE